MPVAELSGVSVVGAGAFNPAIIHPGWLSEKDLIAQNAANDALNSESQPMIVTPQLAVFVADWLSVQVTQGQAVFSTVDLGRELDLRDFAVSVFELLPETPVDAIGINADAHFSAGSAEAWHSFGDRFLPKDFWEPLFIDDIWTKRPDGKTVGMRVMSVEVHRQDPDLPGYVRVEVGPSVRVVPNGIYIGINAHFQVRKAQEDRTTAHDAARILRDQWDDARALEGQLVSHLLEAV